MRPSRADNNVSMEATGIVGILQQATTREDIAVRIIYVYCNYCDFLAHVIQ
jgi:hypothetical protein